MKRRTFIGTCATALTVALSAGGALLGMAAAPALAAYPERPITLIVPWGAGGGTDATARIVGSLLEKTLGQPVNVVNRTGGSGVVGHQAIASSAADGYTLGIATVEIGMMHWQGLTQLTHTDYTPLALMNEDPAGLQVAQDSKFASAKDFLEAVRAKPGSMKASGTGQGGIWHLALAGMLDEADIPPQSVPWVPSQGAAPGLQDLVAGGVQVVPCSLPEARSLIDAGRVKSLAIMAKERNPLFPNIPTLKEQTGIDWTMAAWRGIVGPKGLPQDVSDRLIKALKEVYDSSDFKDFMNQRGFGMIYASGDQFSNFMSESNESLGTVMKAVGIAKQ
ncbi:twin-arginine translocation pathway signal protein [Skermanella stibiiresistens SB22]|uniref:Twin-arginine translocation pathway signal protein n=1 Tax=Skermanella stibiiresistens SB22 TaxID=1385369 RepID=W9H3P2_9PROT|nr:tripartite tricarboxylate transporter substrate binding protein [Skermanella stibiiresistens]EWY39347.1 twin-arginine translocation pathway signal protein [Skermanella stibiiresistens SB22]